MGKGLLRVCGMGCLFLTVGRERGFIKKEKKKKLIACKMEMALINTKTYQKHMVYPA